MKIVLLGGGTGGHFYPLIAVAHALRDVAEEKRIINLELVLVSDRPFDKNALLQEDILFKYIPAGKARRYFSPLYITDTVKTFVGILKAIWAFTLHPPDIIFSKGGYDSFPALVAARIYRIPVMIHESDSIPGLVNKWASKFARRIAISFPETLKHFQKDKTALTGHPLRNTILGGSENAAFDIFNLESGIPTILILGGSQGAVKINDIIITILSELVNKAQIIHSCGKANYKLTKGEAEVVLESSNYKNRYHLHEFLTSSELRNASFVADLIISRAGAGSIFEIAAWKTPSIIIPITKAAQNHQRQNAYNYARTGASIVIEESNLTPHLLLAEIRNILNDKEKVSKMKEAAQSFARIDAAKKIASELIKLGMHD